MTKILALQPRFSDRIPQELDDGTLYISRKFKTAAHNCCCGCGTKIVTPLKPGGWTMWESNGEVTLSPSVGNWSAPCQSHYLIVGNRINWSHKFSKEAIAANRAGDQRVRDHAHAAQLWNEAGFWGRIWIRIKKFWQDITYS